MSLIPVAAVSLCLVVIRSLNKEIRVLPPAGTYQQRQARNIMVKGGKLGTEKRPRSWWIRKRSLQRLALALRNGEIPEKRKMFWMQIYTSV